MKLSDLIRFPAIGWDFDGTLIDNPNAPAYHRFIHANPLIRHVIVTFRTHGWQKEVFAELRHSYENPPGCGQIAEVLNIDDEAWANYITSRVKRLQSQSDAPLGPAEIYYKSWKGLTCAQHGLPVLIDDDLANTELGCLRHGVVLVDSMAIDVDDESAG